MMLAPARVEGAENGTNALSIVQTGDYPVIQDMLSASGTYAFHLATPLAMDNTSDQSQYLTLAPVYLVQSNSTLHFASRLGWAKSDQHARVQVSLDSGMTWQTIYNQDGSNNQGETNFVHRSLALDAFAGKLVRVRFVYAFNSGRYIVHSDGDVDDGWLIDDISLENTEQITSSQTSTLVSGRFQLVPETEGICLLQARAKTGHDYLEWGPLFTAQPQPPAGPPVIAISSFNVTGGQVQIAVYQVSGANPAAWTVESSPTLNGPWLQESAAPVFIARQRYQFSFAQSHEPLRFFRIRAD
jgi:hypothetical protein